MLRAVPKLKLATIEVVGSIGSPHIETLNSLKSTPPTSGALAFLWPP